MLQNHKLGYAFPFSEFEFDTDLNFIILSQGKSFLPVDVHVPLRTSASANTDPSKIYASDAASIQVQGTTSFDAAQLRAWRLLILQNKYKDFAIPETTSDHIQNEFVNMRKEARGPKEDTIGQEDLLRRMGIAR